MEGHVERHLLNMTSVEYMRWLMRDAEEERFFNAEFLSCGGCGGIIIDADRIIFSYFGFMHEKKILNLVRKLYFVMSYY